MREAVAESALPTGLRHETLLAVRNALKLGGSLLATWGVALAVRIVLPRQLGPELFGSLTFADAFSTVAFLPLGLGIDTYIRKEVAVRPGHASDFFGGTLALRAALAVLVFGVMAGVLELTGRPPEVRAVVFLYGGAQALGVLNASFAALLHARGRVGGLSVANVASKLLWAGGVVASLAWGGGLWGLGLAFAGSELVKALVLAWLSRSHLELRLRLDLGATWAVLAASLPFFVNTLARTAYSKLDVNILAFVVDDATEVGWYGAASTLGGLTLLVTPIIGWVIGPLFSRARARSEAEFDGLLRRSMEFVLAVAVPTALVLCLGADLWIRVMFGEAYLPAATSLRLLAPVFVLTYVATLTAIALIQLGRGWALTGISIAGMFLSLGFNLVLAPAGHALLGPNGGGVGCATALLLTEACVTGWLLRTLGGRGFDRRSLVALGKSLAACAVAVVVDRLGAMVGLGVARLLPAGLAYVGVVVATRALPLRDLVQFGREAMRGRGGG